MTNIDFNTVTGTGLSRSRNAINRILGVADFTSISAHGAASIPADVTTVILWGAKTAGDAGAPMVAVRYPQPSTGPTDTGIIRSADRYLPPSNSIPLDTLNSIPLDTFTTDTGAYTLINASIGGGVITASFAADFLSRANALTPGVTYNFSFDVNKTSGDKLRIRTEAGVNLYLSASLPNGPQTLTGSFVADGTTFNLQADNATFAGTIDNLSVTPTSSIIDNINGGYWKYVSTNQPVYLEWFGGAGDFILPGTIPEIGNVNPNPTDNLQPFYDAVNWRKIPQQGGYSIAGATIKSGYGSYWFSDSPSNLDKSICIEGMGLGTIDPHTKWIFASGKAGLRFGSYGEGKRSISHVRDLGIFSLGHGSQTTKHGIEAKSRIYVSNCFINGFGGNGIDIVADVGGGSEASCFLIEGCYIWDNAVDGAHFQGGDANAGSTKNCNFVGNGRWGINDEAFFPNGHFSNHTATNGNWAMPRSGGSYRLSGLNGSGSLVDCYSESDQWPGVMEGHHQASGGLHAAGLEMLSGAVQDYGTLRGGAMEFRNDSQQNFSLGMGGHEEPDCLFRFGEGFPNPDNDIYFTHRKGLGFGFKFGNPVTHAWDFSFLVNSYWSTLREPWFRPNNIVLSHGVYIGGWGNNSDESDQVGGLFSIRRFWVHDNPVTLTNTEHKAGDFAVATDGKSLGRMCTVAGVNAPLWVSGTTYGTGSIIQTAAGNVYRLTRTPYDPDYWIPPRVTIPPTHLSGNASYTEINQEYDCGQYDIFGKVFSPSVPGRNATEHPTAGSFTWVVVDETAHPTTNFSDPSQVQQWSSGMALGPSVSPYTDGNNPYHLVYAGSGDSGTWVRNPANGKTYACTALPVQPTKIYDQAWSMPASTIQPTNTGGAQEYLEPNPAPSGSEPSTIPGYVWTYLHSNTTPAYARVSAPFYENSETFDFPSIANGARSAVRTVTVTGVRLGDHPRRLGCSVNLQGLETNTWISAADKISYQLINNTGAAVDLASATFLLCADRSTQF